MPKICLHMQPPDSQFINCKYSVSMQEIQVLKLSKSMFDIVKHTV